MKRRNDLLFILILFLCFPKYLFSQENHYWATQFGPNSTFLGGAVTGGVRDNSLLFYNPGAAAFTSTFNLSLQSDAVFNQNIYVSNGAGKNLHVHHNAFESAPQLFGLTYGKEKRPNWRTSVGWLTKTYSNIRLRSRNEEIGDYYNDRPGDEYYIGSWNYRSRTREDWYGFALTRKFGGKFGLGISTFLTMRSYEFIETIDQNFLIENPIDPNQLSSIRNVVLTNNMDGAAAGLLWKIGLAYEYLDWKLGFTVTTPRVQVNWLASMTLNSSIYSNFAGADSAYDIPNYSILYDKAQSTYKSPWIIDFGVMKNFLETDIYLRVGFFGDVPLYQMVTPKEEGVVSEKFTNVDDGEGIPFIAHKSVWNVALGWERMYTDKFGMMAGFRTDFNYLDREALQEINGFTPEISYWNLFHFSGGTRVKVLKHNFTVGLTYTFGKKFEEYNFVNLNVPDVEVGEIFSPLEKNADAHVDQLYLTIGYVYNFL